MPMTTISHRERRENAAPEIDERAFRSSLGKVRNRHATAAACVAAWGLRRRSAVRPS
jgi:hypothetical protein